MINRKSYVAFVVVNGKIESGWDYKEDAREHAENTAKSKVLGMRGLKSLGLTPSNDADWLKT